MTSTKIEDLPTVYDPKATEDEMYRFWEEGGFFKADAKSKKPPNKSLTFASGIVVTEII